MKDFFKDLLQYNYHYNKELIAAFEATPEKISEKANLLLSHLINAQNIWNNRILGGNSSGVWDIFPLETLKILNKKNLEISYSILDSEEDLEKIISYQNSTGQPFENKLKDIIFHYLNHSTYHRAQIASEFKNNGLSPLVTDFIFYKR